MNNVPEGAPRSDDGQWWWDGSKWNPVEGGQDQQKTAPELAFNAETGQQAELPEVESVA